MISNLLKIAGIVTFTLASTTAIANAQNRTAPTSKMQLKSPDVEAPGQRVRCRAEGVIQTLKGTVLECTGQNGNGALLAMPKGSLDLALAMTNDSTEPYRVFIVDKPHAQSLQACTVAKRLGNKPCFQVLVARMNNNDSPVNVGSANPDNGGPNIPSRPADPNWPNIPSGTAGQN